MNTVKSGSPRRSDLDVLRILGCFLVCYNHTEAFNGYLWMAADGSLFSILRVILAAVTTLNIPLFFMLSGALLLGREEPYPVLLKKRVGRFLILLTFASLGVYLLKGESRSVSGFLYSLLRGDITTSYWYFYAYLSFLLILPFLRKIAPKLGLGDMVFLTVLRLIFVSLRPMGNFFLTHGGMEPVALSSSFQIILASLDFTYFPLLGYYLGEKVDAAKIKPGLCWLVFGASVALSAGMTYVQGYLEAFTQEMIGLFRYTMAAAAFLLVRRGMAGKTLPDRLGKGLAALSGAVVGIYIFEPVVHHFLYQPFFDLSGWSPVLSLPFSLLWCGLCMVLGAGATLLLRKLPGVKKIL